jgi:hypothetical protein
VKNLLNRFDRLSTFWLIVHSSLQNKGAGSRQQAAEGICVEGRRQQAEGRSQKAEGRKQKVSRK